VFLWLLEQGTFQPINDGAFSHKRHSDNDLRRISELDVQRGEEMRAEVIASQPEEDGSNDPDSGNEDQLSIDDFIRPAD
jgi:hypothetical protein